MNLFIICSKHFYDKIPKIAEELKSYGHNLTFPNSYEEPFKEEEMKKVGSQEHSEWKRNMMKLQEPKIRANEGVLIYNLNKNGIENYIGGATFMEIVKAWELDKKVFFYNPIPECIFTDELKGINPIIINKDLSKII